MTALNSKHDTGYTQYETTIKICPYCRKEFINMTSWNKHRSRQHEREIRRY